VSRRGSLPWPVRSVVAGFAGTAAMVLAYRVGHDLRPRVDGPLDYDDSLGPGQIVAKVLGMGEVSEATQAELRQALLWGYGSAFGLWHGLLRTRLREPWASIVFGATLMSATFSLFPALGDTPPPWEWPPDVLATSVATHVAYVVTVAVVDDAGD
jgi:uncharacterized membrane protein YagU involved in acid resistance